MSKFWGKKNSKHHLSKLFTIISFVPILREEKFQTSLCTIISFMHHRKADDGKTQRQWRKWLTKIAQKFSKCDLWNFSVFKSAVRKRFQVIFQIFYKPWYRRLPLPFWHRRLYFKNECVEVKALIPMITVTCIMTERGIRTCKWNEFSDAKDLNEKSKV